jgi:hypothetical protein
MGDELLVVDPSPIVATVDRLERKGGREVIARCPSQEDADQASEWLLDRSLVTPRSQGLRSPLVAGNTCSFSTRTSTESLRDFHWLSTQQNSSSGQRRYLSVIQCSP